MNYTSILTSNNLFGVFELDKSGTIHYFGAGQNGTLHMSEPDLAGRNFFYDAASFKNIDEFQWRFKSFVSTSAASDSFDFKFKFYERAAKVKVMFLRVHQRDFDGNSEMIIADIREI
jgi:photoactive yellow protein